MIDGFILYTTLILFAGIDLGLLIAVISKEIQKRKLYKNGVLHTSKGTFVTTNSDGGYTFTPKPKFSKGGLNVW